MNLDLARRAADSLLDTLRPCCAQAEIAGSVRRGKAQPHDVELVLAPAFAPNPYRGDFFQDAPDRLDLLEERLRAMRQRGVLLRRLNKQGHPAWGPRYVRALYQWERASVPVDIFIVRPPAQWGLIYFIRTGSAEYVADALRHWKTITGGGYSKDGALHDARGTFVPTPTEADVFKALGWKWTEPEERSQKEEGRSKNEELPAQPPRLDEPAESEGYFCRHEWTGPLVEVEPDVWRATCAKCGELHQEM
jgi:DNA polymerase/3'-5' exonuclease PolX